MICISIMLNGLDIPRNHVNIIKQKKRFSIKNGKRFSIKNGLLRFLINPSHTVERGAGLMGCVQIRGSIASMIAICSRFCSPGKGYWWFLGGLQAVSKVESSACARLARSFSDTLLVVLWFRFWT